MRANHPGEIFKKFRLSCSFTCVLQLFCWRVSCVAHACVWALWVVLASHLSPCFFCGRRDLLQHWVFHTICTADILTDLPHIVSNHGYEDCWPSNIVECFFVLCCGFFVKPKLFACNQFVQEVTYADYEDTESSSMVPAKSRFFRQLGWRQSFVFLLSCLTPNPKTFAGKKTNKVHMWELCGRKWARRSPQTGLS